MPTVEEAKNDVQSTLSGMGYAPYRLIITELITESKDSYWQIKGEFQDGFVGETLKFEIKYDPQTRGIGNTKVFPTSSRSDYA